MQLELVLKQLEEQKPDKALELLTRCYDSAQSSLSEVRRALRTEEERDLDPVQTITQLVRQINQDGTENTENAESKLTIKTDLDDIDLPLTVQHQIFSIIQECVTNIRKHACANHVEISLKQKDGLVSLCVRDDGKGFEVGSSNSRFGLKGMRERALTIGATIKLESTPGKGTEVWLTFPLTVSRTQSMIRK